jgi:neutral ceramidase
MSDYKIGAGIADMTGPVYDGVMMGFAEENQKTRGIHLRQYARAFVILHKATGKRVAIVVIDTWSSTIALNREVVQRLQHEPGVPKGVFTTENVMITGQHTHAGPGGFSEYELYNLTIGGFDKRCYEAHAAGVVESIKRANRNLVDGDILTAKGIVTNCGKNRSLPAYYNNEGVKPGDKNTTDRTMLLLKFVSSRGREIGSLNWYAIHTTSMAQYNELISGDNKGYASYLMERDKGTNPYSTVPTYVAAFANANCGDVSGNVRPPEPSEYLTNTYKYGRRQYEKATHLANIARRKLSGPVDYRHTFIPIADIRERITHRRLTWPACYGISFARGSSVDGIPSLLVPGIHEGITVDDPAGLDVTLRDLIRQILTLAKFEGKHPRVTDEVRKGHGKKPIIFAPGLFDPPLAPAILPVQLFRIGPVLVAGVPAEITTMAGRRLRQALLDVFEDDPERDEAPVNEVMVTPNANAYSGYITTREEYEVQHYEGASTLYGPNTAKAYRQEFVRLAEAMRDQKPSPPGPTPPNLLATADKKKLEYPTGSKPAFGPRKFGDLIAFPKREYRRGETVSATIIVADPFIDKKRADTFMAVLKNVGTAAKPRWRRVATDRDPDTFVRWSRYILDSFQLTVTWIIPDDAEPGQYKIRHRGYFKRSPQGNTGTFLAVTPVFEVKS